MQSDKLPPNVWDILRLTAKRARPISDLCERLGINAKAFSDAVKAANAAGFRIRVADGFVSSRAPAIQANAETLAFGDTRPGRKRVALVTDLHFGSRHTNLNGLQAFLEYAKTRGVSTIVCTGDVLDGNKEVLLHDQEKIGWDSQAAAAVAAIAPHRFRWVAIDGNHDGYFSASAGTTSGRLLEAEMRTAGVDWTFAGVCLGRAMVHGARWLLWHPHGGASTRNAIRRILNGKIEGLEEPADVVAIGHFHKFATVAAFPEGVFGVAGGTFQEKKSEFANRISNGWDIGGAIVSWTLDKEGHTSEYAAEFYPVPGN